MSKTPIEQLTAAIDIANRAHAGQCDRGGAPYIFHCFWVMERQLTANRKICAVMHDSIEDGDVTIESLRAAGFSESQLITMDLLSRREGESEMAYIRRMIAAKDTAEGQDAIHIKIDDNHHNSMLERLSAVTEADHARQRRRAKIHALLKDACTFDGFLDGQNLEKRMF